MIATGLTFEIPGTTKDEFYRLPAPAQDEVRAMLRIIARIDGAGNLKAACKAEAMALQDRHGFSAASLRRKYSDYRRTGGDWRVLVNRARVKDEKVKLGDAFVSYWKGQCEGNQRKCMPAYRELIRDWRNGKSIPGYGTWREWFRAEFPHEPCPAICPPDLPRGWTYRNLARYKPDAVELDLARQGIAAAALELPSIIGTRKGLRFLEWIVLDDWRSDIRVHAGAPAPVKLNGILAMDVACALPLRFGLRPAIVRKDDSEDGIKRRDTLNIIAGILITYGYPVDYKMNIIVERGTATLSPDDAQAIYDITNGQVIVHYTNMIAGKVFGFADRPIGNFKGKAWLESSFNLIHNEMASLPGQMGARYQLQPAELAARMKHSEALVCAAAAYPEALGALRLPVLTKDQAKERLEFVFQYMKHRHEHDLEDFAETLVWREKRFTEWRPHCELEGVSDLMLDKIETAVRKESPIERMARLKHGVTFESVAKSGLYRLLEEHRTVTVEKPGEIAFVVDGKDRVYQDRKCAALVKDAQFLVHYDRQDPEWVHLVAHKANGVAQYVASISHVRAVTRDDSELLSARMAEKQEQLNRSIAEVRKHKKDAIAKQLADTEHNLQLLEQATSFHGDGAPNLLPVRAGAVAAVPEFSQRIDAHYEARAEERQHKIDTAKRVERCDADIDDLLYHDEAGALQRERDEYAAAEADLDELERLY